MIVKTKIMRDRFISSSIHLSMVDGEVSEVEISTLQIAFFLAVSGAGGSRGSVAVF